MTASPNQRAASTRQHRHSRAFQIGFAMAVANTLIGATQPVLTRYAAVRLDPILFRAAVTSIAAMCALPILYRRGELPRLFDKRYLPWLVSMSMAGTVMTSLTLIALVLGADPHRKVGGVIEAAEAIHQPIS